MYCIKDRQKRIMLLSLIKTTVDDLKKFLANNKK